MKSIKKKRYIYVLLTSLLSLPIFLFKFDLRVAEIWVVIVYAFAIYSWIKITKSLTSLYFFFLIYCFFCNAGQSVLHLFGNELYGLSIYKLYSEILIVKMLVFQSLCIVAMHCGALLFYKRYENYKYSESNLGMKVKEGVRNVTTLITDFAFIVFLVIMFIQYLYKFFARVGADYGEFYYSESGSTSVPLILVFMFYIFLFIALWNHSKEKDSRRSYIFISVAVLVMLMLVVGSRSLIIPLLAGILFITNLRKVKYKVKSRSKKFLSILAVISILYVLQAISVLRTYAFSQLTIEIVSRAFSEGILKSFLNLLSEMGGSARCVIQTISSVDSYPSLKENTMLYAFLKSFLQVDLIRYLGLETTVGSLSYWITKIGGGLEGTASWGYSIIGEAYFNLGMYGWILMFLFGVVWSTIENLIRSLLNKGNIVSGMAFTYLLAYMIFASRAELLLFSLVGRYCFYIFILSSFVMLIFKKKMVRYGE